MTRNKMQMHDNNAAKPYRTPLIASAMSSWNMTCRAKVALLRQSLRYRKPAEEGESGKRQATRPHSICHGFGKFRRISGDRLTLK